MIYSPSWLLYEYQNPGAIGRHFYSGNYNMTAGLYLRDPMIILKNNTPYPAFASKSVERI
jgi:hypothetical protein